MEKVPNEPIDFYKFCRDRAMGGHADSGAFAISVAIQQVAEEIDTLSDQVSALVEAVAVERPVRLEISETMIRIADDVRSFVRIHADNTISQRDH